MGIFKRLFFITLLLASFHSLFAQQIISGKVLNKEDSQPLPYANVQLVPGNQSKLTNVDGTYSFRVDENVEAILVSYIGFKSKKVPYPYQENLIILLEPEAQQLNEVVITNAKNKADEVIAKALARKPKNDPKERFSSYQYSAYNKFVIDNENNGLRIQQDTLTTSIETVVETGKNYLAEKNSLFQFQQKKGLKETILATRTAGFKEPVYELLTTNVQSTSWYEKDYVIFGSEYASPLGKNPLKNYNYKILDTTQTNRPAYAVLFQPKNQQKVAGLEGVLYIDTENYGIQKAIGQLKGSVNLEAVEQYNYFEAEDIWFPQQTTVTIRPGTGNKDIAIFGSSIDLGNLPADTTQENLFLKSETTFQEVEFDIPIEFEKNQSAVSLAPNAMEASEEEWKQVRTIPFTYRDEITFEKVDSIIKAENIDRKIEVIQHFNQGYYPLGFFDFDLRRFIKYNQYEGLRLGVGGITNDKLSEKFRLQGYGVYGFTDKALKYSAGVGFLLNKEKQTWLTASYTDDIAEVGSFFYLTDARVYSLFEPRLVNITSYYKYQTPKISLQHQFTPKLLSEFSATNNDISQTFNYAFLNDGIRYTDYRTTEVTASFRWSPFSDYLTSSDRNIEIKKGFPLFSFQAVQSVENLFGSDFNYTKLGVKANYTKQRLNQTSTQFIFEGLYGFGDLPLMQSFHAFPNNPIREKLMRRFSVAGRRTFETMYFNEFFSDKLANLQIKHFFKPWNIGKYSNPQLVLLTRHAIGTMNNPEKHQGITFNTLDHGYSESGFEVNNILSGFGLNFAYRYGAYYLPEFEDNISIKFTFYFKL